MNLETISVIIAIIANAAGLVTGYVKLREDVAKIKTDIDWIKDKLSY